MTETDLFEQAGLSDFFAAWEFFREPALAGAIAGALLGLIGVYVVLRRMVFFSAALSQSAGLGVTLAYFLQLHLGVSAALMSPTLGALILTVGASALLLTGDDSRRSRQRDSLLGLVYLVGAAGTLLLGGYIVQEVQDVQSILLGTAVAVLPEDFRLLLVTAVLLLALHAWWLRGFVQVTFDREGSRIRGLPIGVLEFALLLSTAVAISISTRVIGALPVFAFSVLPALAAIRLSPTIPTALALSGLIGATTGFSGYIIAFLYDFPVGATQTAVGAFFVLLAFPVGALLRIPQRVRKHD